MIKKNSVDELMNLSLFLQYALRREELINILYENDFESRIFKTPNFYFSLVGLGTFKTT